MTAAARPLLIAEGSEEPISVEEAGFNLRAADDGNSPPTYVEAALIGRLIRAAREACERILERSLVRKTLELSSDSFYARTRHVAGRAAEYVEYAPGDPLTQYYGFGNAMPNALNGYLELPFGPVRRIVSVRYLDQNGDDQLLDPSKYRFSAYQTTPVLLPPYGGSWPSIRRDLDCVRVRYEVGYPSDDSPAQTVPEPIRIAMHLLISHWYQNREGVYLNGLTAEMPLGVRDMLMAYRDNMGV